MFIRRKKYDRLVTDLINLRNRVAQLEDLICPNESHDYMKITDPATLETHFICTKCKRIVDVKPPKGNRYLSRGPEYTVTETHTPVETATKRKRHRRTKAEIERDRMIEDS